MRTTNKLSDTKLRAAKPRATAYKLADGGGLFLLVKPDGSRYWRLKYRFAGKENLLGLGHYPGTQLAQARRLRDEAKAQLAAGIDPSQVKRATRRAASESAGNSFETIAREWHALKAKSGWTANYSLKVLQAFEALVFPAIGRRPVNEIRAGEMLAVLRRIESRGTVDRAKRVRQKCGEVFRYAVVIGRAESNPAADLAHALLPAHPTHYAALSAEQLPEFLRVLTADQRLAQTTRLGLRLLALTFVRPGELQGARWAEFDLDTGLWTIPAARMKKRREHVVPLAPPALVALRSLHELTGSGEFLFPGRDDSKKSISSNTFRLALHKLGFEVTAHGFRATASTILNEMGFRSEVIEAQLAHMETNKVRKAYNRAQYLDERRDLMHQWSDYLIALEQGGKVIPINSQRKGAAT